MRAGDGPPPGADRLLARFLPPGMRGSGIVADLHLEYRDVVRRRGRGWARVWYWKEAVALAARYVWVGTGVHASHDGRAEMGTFLADLRYGLRILAKTPGLSLVAVLTIALGVGLTTQTYSYLDGTVLRGLPVPDADRFMFVTERIDRLGIDQNSVPLHDLIDLEERQTTFEDLAAYQWSTFDLADDASPPERVQGAVVSGDALEVVGVPPLLGRVFRPGEDGPDTPPRMVLSYRLWQNRFAGDPGIVGRVIRVDGEATEIVGVMPEGFRWPFDHSAWMPLRYDPAVLGRRSGHVEVFGRRLPGVSEADVNADLERVSLDLERIYPEENDDVRIYAAPFAERYMPKEITAVMFLMLAATLGVLLIACANVANLLLARSASRGREVAVRSALGASRGRVIRQLLIETLVIAALGGLLGVGLAWGSIELFERAIVDIEKPYWIVNRLDLPALAFALGAVLVSTLAAGVIPAVRASGLGVGRVLGDAARGSSSRRLGRLTSALVVTEIAVSCGLLVASGLMIRSVINLRNTDLGFAPDQVVAGRVTLSRNAYPTRDDRRAFFQTVEDRLRAEPGAAAVGLASDLPGLGGGSWWVRVDGQDYAREGDVPLVAATVATEGIYDALGIPLRQGRAPTPAEVWSADEQVVVVSQTFVDRYLRDRDPLGVRIFLSRDPTADVPGIRIVGVAGDVHVGGGVGGLGDDQRSRAFVYLTPGSIDVTSMAAAVRTRGAPAAFGPTLRRQVNELDPDLPVSELAPLSEAIRDATWAFGLFGSLFTIFGLAALFMASVGLYGVMAHSVTQRRLEIGVRMALGAAPARILRMVLNEGTAQLVLGMVLGLGLGWALSRPLSFITYGVRLSDPFLYLFIVATLGSVGLAACIVPARAATRADPAKAMRP